jgi:hypothetical protein
MAGKIERAKQLLTEYALTEGGALSARKVQRDLAKQGVSDQAFWKAWWAIHVNLFLWNGRFWESRGVVWNGHEYVRKEK